MFQLELLLISWMMFTISGSESKMENISGIRNIDYKWSSYYASTQNHLFTLTDETKRSWKISRCSNCISFSEENFACSESNLLTLDFMKKIYNHSISITMYCFQYVHFENGIFEMYQIKEVDNITILWNTTVYVNDYDFCIRQTESFLCQKINTGLRSHKIWSLKVDTEYEICIGMQIPLTYYNFGYLISYYKSSGYKCGNVDTYLPVPVWKKIVYFFVIPVVSIGVLVVSGYISWNVIIKKRHLQNSSKNGNVEIENIYEEEFQKLQDDTINIELGKRLTKNAGLLLGNVKRNRYPNIVPYDQSRVILKKKETSNDYINASFISFKHDKRKAEYIAAQDPMMQSIWDFWEMIWQENVNVIVMLSSIKDIQDANCVQYFPDQTNKKFTFGHSNEIVVHLKSEKRSNLCTERELILENKNSEKHRNIFHLQMDGWKRNTNPPFNHVIYMMIRYREITEVVRSPPYLIHCHNGVGPTGVFITLDRLTRKLSTIHRQENICDTILDIRECRPFMVETLQDYSFINCYMKYYESNLSKTSQSGH